jgi:anti-sigma-K factor RskA
MNRQELLDLIPAYVLGTLDANEAAAVADLLRDDPEAQRLHADYLRVSEALLYSVPVPPLTDRLAAGLHGQLPASSRVSAYRMLALAAAIILLLGAALLIPSLNTPTPEALYRQLVADASAVRVPLDSGDVAAVTGELIYLPGEDLAVIRAENLPALTQEQILQLWLAWPNDALANGGLFRPSAENTLMVRVPLDRAITEYVRLGFSLEPAAGSPFPDSPSGPRVCSASIRG